MSSEISQDLALDLVFVLLHRRLAKKEGWLLFSGAGVVPVVSDLERGVLARFPYLNKARLGNSYSC